MAVQILIVDSIGREIKIMRKNVGWTQQELAAKSGVSALTIGRIENEEIEPEKETANKLIAAFGFTYKIKYALEDNQKTLTSELPKKKKRF